MPKKEKDYMKLAEEMLPKKKNILINTLKYFDKIKEEVKFGCFENIITENEVSMEINQAIDIHIPLLANKLKEIDKLKWKIKELEDRG